MYWSLNMVIMEPIVQNKKQPPEFMDVIEAVICYHFRIDKWKIQQVTRLREIVKVRQLCHAMSKLYTKASLAKIGLRFGRKDHATVLHSIKVVNNLRDTNLEYRGIYYGIREKIEKRIYLIETGEHDTSLVCVVCGGKKVFTRIWLNANTGKIVDEEFMADCVLDNWCENCEEPVELKQRNLLYIERKDLERAYKIEREAAEYQKKLQAIKDEFEK